ncbi:MAG: hypothetical protein ABSG01_14255 [Anaerolineales bacterium]|jgi:hypothetical protein
MKKTVLQEEVPIVETVPSPKEQAVATLEAARADLAACDGEIAKANAEKAAAESGIPTAPDTEKATELIRQVQASEALIVSYLRPKRERLVAAVTAAASVVTHLSQQARMEVLAGERLDNQIAIAAADQDVRQAMLDLSAKVMEVCSRYQLLKAQMQELQSLTAAGCISPATEAVPAVQTFDEIISELAKFGTLDWRPTIDFNSKMSKAPIFKSEVRNG